MIWRKNDQETNCGPEVVQRDKADRSSGSDQYSREIMHVRQSNGSKVSSFDAITGHLVRFLVTLYTKHGEVSHPISYCCDERRQWSHASVLKTTSLDVLLNMQVTTSYNKHV